MAPAPTAVSTAAPSGAARLNEDAWNESSLLLRDHLVGADGLLQGFGRVDQVLLRLELGDVGGVCASDGVRVFDVQLRDGVLVVPLSDEGPRGVLVLALGRYVPDRARSSDGERRAALRGRVQHVVHVLLRGRLVERCVLPPAVDPAALEEKRELALALLLTHRGPGLRCRQ